MQDGRRPGGHRVVGVVGDRVDRDDVSVVGQVSGPDGGQVPALSVEHADGAALGGDVKTLRSLVVGQDVGSAHPCRSRKLTRVSAAASGSPRADIENRQICAR